LQNDILKSKVNQNTPVVNPLEVPACLLVHNSASAFTLLPFAVPIQSDYFPSASVLFDVDSISGPECPDNRSFLLHLYRNDVLVKRPSRTFKHDHYSGAVEIFEFSQRSANRLSFVARNSGHVIKSQFCCTFHNAFPSDGLEVKRIFNNFLTRVRRSFPGVSYLWCMEFQTRKAPHFHFFSDLPATAENHQTITDDWLECVGLENDEKARWFHMRKENFFTWSMLSGSYLIKDYISKSIQKKVPENFKNCGRFWGCSRNMKPEFTLIDPGGHDAIEYSTCVKAVRAVRKVVENRIDNFRKLASKKSRVFTELVTSDIPESIASKIVRGFRLYPVHEKKSVDEISQQNASCATVSQLVTGVLASPRVSPRARVSGRLRSYALPLASALFFQFLNTFNAPIGSFLNLGSGVIATGLTSIPF
jgi:hypothetical protein